MKIDKSKWTKVTFGDIATESRDTIHDCEGKSLARYIGLDHIDPENLSISRWGEYAEGVSFTKTFKEGDILFGRRRAYQKKAAIAPFDGVCSGDILVFRPKVGQVDPTLFPFLIQNDRFFDFAMKTSAGSLSPRTKFKDLSRFELLLPPLDQQKELADLLWSGNNLLSKYHQQELLFTEYLSAAINNLIWEAKHPGGHLCNIAVNKKFVDGDWIENKNMSSNGVRLIQLADIGDKVFINKSKRYISNETFSKLNCFQVLPGDLLLARMPDPIGRTCEIPDLGQKMITAVDCCIIRIEENKHNKKYWLYVLNSSRIRRAYETISSGTTRQRISKSKLEKLLVPSPDLHTQNNIADKLQKIDNLRISFTKQASKIHSFNKSLADEIFSISLLI